MASLVGVETKRSVASTTGARYRMHGRGESGLSHFTMAPEKTR
jgi:hypothetical protein